MQSVVRVQSKREFYPELEDAIKEFVSDSEIQYALQGFHQSENSSFSLRTVIVLTQNRVLYASRDNEGKGMTIGCYYANIVGVEEKSSDDGNYHWVSIISPSLPTNNIRFDFSTPQEVHSFAAVVRRYAHL